ncbi:uncharacterized protein LOC135368966 isoform X2 [Ornithodoros turicata]|uniref:uncharacterized protein LOC135368966 isoform X2 n=1 Tax=Ornithodoros turicata TaxID=34597 RepID=UPI003139BE9A
MAEQPGGGDILQQAPEAPADGAPAVTSGSELGAHRDAVSPALPETTPVRPFCIMAALVVVAVGVGLVAGGAYMITRYITSKASKGNDTASLQPYPTGKLCLYSEPSLL